MAQKIQILLVDDIDGGDAVETVTFGVDGNSYEIDLSAENAARLREAVALYVAHARRAGRAGGAASPSRRAVRGAGVPERDRIQVIREWARQNGHKVSDRGRIPGHIMEEYDRAN
jgi:hypothetical protein